MNSTKDNTSSMSAITLKRIFRDLQELERNPLPGIAVCIPNPSKPLILHANVRLLDGIYEGVLLHLIVRLPPNYPHTGPEVNIAPGLEFGCLYHSHVFADEGDGKGGAICLDLLTNSGHLYMYEASRHDRFGWTSAYTLSTLMIQLQIFFADPHGACPSKENITTLFTMVKNFKTEIDLGDGTFAEHSYEKPYPPVDPVSETEKEIEMLTEKEMEISTTKEIEISTAKEVEDDVKRIVGQKLYCFASRCTLFDESLPVLGFPLKVTSQYEGSRSKLFTLLFEMMSSESYDADMAESRTEESRGWETETERTEMHKSGLGDLYNRWLPIYINEEHWARAKDHVLKSLSAVCSGGSKSEATFRPSMVLEVLPAVLSGIIFKLVKNHSYENMQAIESYCFFYRLFLRLLDEFPHLRKTIDREVESAISRRSNRRKDRLPDIYKFFVMLSVSKYGISNTGINGILIEELFARGVNYNSKFYQKGLTDGDTRRFLSSFVDLEKETLRRVALTLEFSRLMKETSIELLDKNYGLLSEEVAMEFTERVAFLAGQISESDGWKIFLECVRPGESDLRDMQSFLWNVVSVAEDQRYVARSGSRAHDFDVQTSKKTVKVYVPKQSESEPVSKSLNWGRPKVMKIYTPKLQTVF